jgi:transposase
MLMLPSSVRVFVCCETIDLRRSFDTLAEAVRSILGEDPFGGHLFVFFSRSFNAVKILHWEPNGFWIHYKRLERGTFKLPVNRGSCMSLELGAQELSLILEGISLDGAKHRAKFERMAI